MNNRIPSTQSTDTNQEVTQATKNGKKVSVTGFSVLLRHPLSCSQQAAQETKKHFDDDHNPPAPRA